MVHTGGRAYHSGCRIRKVDHIGRQAGAHIQIDQLLRCGSVADNMRSLRTGGECNRIPFFQTYFTLRSTHNGMAFDDIKYFFIHFMVMIAIGVRPRLHFHETGRTFSGIRFLNDRPG